jgi:urease accessory protein
MPRAIRVIPAGHPPQRSASDTLILPFAQRQSPRGVFTAARGTHVEIDLAQAARFRTDDRLMLDDGSMIEIVAEPEPLLEVRAADLAGLARLAWHLGDRHVPVEMLPNRLRVRRDAAIESLLLRLGAKVAAIEAPFEPEGGAYAAAGHHQHHHDTHGSDHTHSDAHGHDHGSRGHGAHSHRAKRESR